MTSVFLVLIAGVSLALLVREWGSLLRTRRQLRERPTDEDVLDYVTARMIFARRALISLVLLTIVALIANQATAMAFFQNPRAKLAYLALYFLMLALLYVLVLLDIKHGRALIRRLERSLYTQQESYLKALTTLAKREEREDRGIVNSE